MSIKKLLLSITALALASNSQAGLIGVEIFAGPSQHPDGLHDTWRIVARFSDANDVLFGVGGLGDNPIHFWTGGGVLYNQALSAGLPINDFPSASLGGEEYDSYVTTGATDFPHNTQFTDDFLGDWGGKPPPVQVIQGSSFSSTGGWFYLGDPPPVSVFDSIPDNDTFDVVIAQFTIDKGVGFHLEANIDVGAGGFTPFVVDNIPSPGASALLGILALTATRRRRK